MSCVDAMLKPVVFIRSSLGDLSAFPADVVREVGYALHQAQEGVKSPKAKPLKGFGGASVLEVVESFQTDAYRAVYTVRFPEAVYVLHCFQKKSKRGIGTPLQEIETVKRRLAEAEELHSEWEKEE